MRLALLCAAALIAAVPPAAAEESPEPAEVQASSVAEQPPPLTKHELLRKYVWSTLGPAGALHATVTSALEQWRGAPKAWAQDGQGYAARWASEYGAEAIGNTTKYAVARMFHQDPSFVRCECTGKSRRLGHALTSPFKARTRDGQREFSLATAAGLTAQEVIPAATWYPAPRGVHDGFDHALSGVLSKVAVDVFREFVPDSWTKKFTRKPI